MVLSFVVHLVMNNLSCVQAVYILGTMELWLSKALVAMVAIVPAFLAIPFFRANYGVDPLVFLLWYFAGTTVSIALFFLASGRGQVLISDGWIVLIIIAIGLTFGALANGLLFQSVGIAPSPGLPPVIYESASMLVFVFSVLLARLFPEFFTMPISDLGRFIGLIITVIGLYFVAGGLEHLKSLFS